MQESSLSVVALQDVGGSTFTSYAGQSDPPTLTAALELGPWNVRVLEHLIGVVREQNLDGPASASFWTRVFLNTPFEYESRLPALPKDQLRVRLSSFECFTLIYHVLAIAGARNVDDYIRRLYRIRFKSPHAGSVSEDPRDGNFLAIPCEAVLFNCIDVGILEDITARTTDESGLTRVEMKLRPIQRLGAYAPHDPFVYPQFPDRPIDTLIAKAATLPESNQRVRAGDVIVFTRGSHRADGEPNSTFVSHIALADTLEDGALGFIHATKHYHVRGRARPSDMSFLRMLPGHPEKALPGVVHGCEPLGNEATVSVGGSNYQGYDCAVRRTLSSYARSFEGIKILRLLS